MPPGSSRSSWARCRPSKKKSRGTPPGRAPALDCKDFLEADELVADATGDHQRVAEVAHVVRVDVHAGIPLVPLVPDAAADAVLHVVRAGGGAARRSAGLQVD